MERLGWLLKRQVAQRDWPNLLRTAAWLIEEAWLEHRHGLHTEGKIAQQDLSGIPEGQSYEAVSYRALRAIFKRIAPAPGDHDVFLDAGCGMGRALAAAARYPFQRVEGFDISQHLVTLAHHNLAVPNRKRRCQAVHVTQANAAHYAVPDDVTTVFLFNPFRGSILEAFLNQLAASLLRRPRRLRLVVANPAHFQQAAASLPWLHQIDEFTVFHPRMEQQHHYRLSVHLYEARPSSPADTASTHQVPFCQASP